MQTTHLRNWQLFLENPPIITKTSQIIHTMVFNFYTHYKKQGLQPRLKNAAIDPKNVAIGYSCVSIATFSNAAYPTRTYSRIFINTATDHPIVAFFHNPQAKTYSSIFVKNVAIGRTYVSVWIHVFPSHLQFFFFFPACMNSNRTVHAHGFTVQETKRIVHGTIHTFKNYFATVFLVFSKISCIQTDPITAFFTKTQL